MGQHQTRCNIRVSRIFNYYYYYFYMFLFLRQTEVILSSIKSGFEDWTLDLSIYLNFIFFYQDKKFKFNGVQQVTLHLYSER